MVLFPMFAAPSVVGDWGRGGQVLMVYSPVSAASSVVEIHGRR